MSHYQGPVEQPRIHDAEACTSNHLLLLGSTLVLASILDMTAMQFINKSAEMSTKAFESTFTEREKKVLKLPASSSDK